MNISRKLVRPLAVVGTAVAAPLLFAAPGQASIPDSGCTVTPDRPVYSGVDNQNNRPYIDYTFTATCEAGLSVEVRQVRAEQDLLAREGDPADDTTGTFTKVFNFANAGTKSKTVRVLIPNTGPASEGGREELYQKVKFSVTSGPVSSPFTPWELTNVRAIHH